MKAKQITRLTSKQLAMLQTVRDEWLAHGLATGPADRAEAERGVREAYVAAGLRPPRFLIWLDSPWAGAVGQAIAPEIIARYMRGQVRGQVADQVTYEVDDQVNNQVRGQVDDQVDVGLAEQVRGQLRVHLDIQVDTWVSDQVRGQVDGQVAEQVHVGLAEQMLGQLRGQVDDQVRGQLREVAEQVAGQLRGQVRGQVADQVDDQVDDRLLRWWRGYMAGQHWAGYYSYYDALQRIGVTSVEPLHGQMRVARNAGWWWCYRDFAVLTERPAVLHRDGQGRLHHETGPALRYPDGWAIWAWHGVRVAPWVIDGTATAAKILREPNAEIRRCAIEVYGWPWFIADADLKQVGSSVPDPGNPGQELALYDVPERIYDVPVRVLIATNGTEERSGERRRFGLTVPASIGDPLSAAAWGYGLAAIEYARLERRS